MITEPPFTVHRSRFSSTETWMSIDTTKGIAGLKGALRYVRAYRDHGLDGLRPPPRADLGIVRRHPELLECRPTRKPIWYALDAAVQWAIALIVVVSGGISSAQQRPTRLLGRSRLLGAIHA